MKSIFRAFLKICVWVLMLVVAVLALFSVWAFVRERDDVRAIAPSEGAYVKAADVNLYIQTKGNKTNPPILLVHGMAAWSETWRPVMEQLAESGWYVIAVDMPPFGFSERPLDMDVWRTAQARRINELLATLNIPRITIVGHSYGSRAVLETAMRYPERVQGVVLVDPALSGIYANQASSQSPAVSFIAEALLRYPVVASTMTNPLLSRTLLTVFLYDAADATDEILAVYRAPATIKNSTRDMGFWMRGFIIGADQGLSTHRENYTNLNRVALIWGEEDTTTPLSQGRELANLIGNTELIVIPGVGHIPHIEDVGAFNGALNEALAVISQ